MIKLAITEATPDPTSDEEAQCMLGVQDPSSRKLISRVSLYPLTSFLCHLGQMLASLYYTLTHNKSDFLTICDLIGSSLVGAVNMLCFLYDPYIQYSFYHIKVSLKGRREHLERNTLSESGSQEGSSFTENGILSDTTGVPIKPHKDAVYNPVSKCYINPIPIPGARDPEEMRKEKWYTTDLHLHPKHFYKTRF